MGLSEKRLGWEMWKMLKVKVERFSVPSPYFSFPESAKWECGLQLLYIGRGKQTGNIWENLTSAQ